MSDELFRTALEELGQVLAGVDSRAVDEACAMLAGARTIGVYGCGREALQVRGFAMRLFHLGLPVAVVGDMTMPPLGPGDVLLSSSGPGETATVLALMRIAREAGAANLLLTAQSGSGAARLADLMLPIPVQTMASDQGAARTSVLPMGSLFEGALFLLFEIMVLKLRRLTGETPQTMRARHTNME